MSETQIKIVLEKLKGLESLFLEKFAHNSEQHELLKNKSIIIDKKVSLTNGRVKKLELWKAFLIGAWTVVSVGFPIMFIYYVNALKNDFKNEITIAIEQNNNKFFEIDK